MLALTSRVTKLGTLVAWANAFDLVDGYLMTIHKRLTGLDTNIKFDQLIKMTDPTLDKYNKDDHNKVKFLDQRSPNCWPGQVCCVSTIKV